MKTTKLIAGVLVMLGFAGCEPEESPGPNEDGLPRCQEDMFYPLYGPPTCYWESRATIPQWLEPSEGAVLFVDEVQTQADENQ
ncbi:MAG: hypothetical protein LBV38_05030 [Alistipes sp.]|nr:hypothetical protein [Alistipes sp.]